MSLDAGESIRAEPGAMVSHSDGISVETETSGGILGSVNRVGGLESTLFSGEDLVCRFTGPGRVWLQSRSQDVFLSLLVPQLPTSNIDGDGGFPVNF